ncbi:MAG: hypothetical protein GY807_10180 [Gammaproteobacteria bacterium]|nr:hypothetical protein [Gammaproteobacteria bacterium]
MPSIQRQNTSASGLATTIDEQLPLAQAVEEFKRHRIRRALDATKGNQAKAAELLGVRPSNLSRLLKKMRMAEEGTHL